MAPVLADGPVAPGIVLRRARTVERPRLYAWHIAAYREHIERLGGWDDAWQRHDFSTRCDDSPPQVIVLGEDDAGYLQVRRLPQRLHLENIVLAGWARNRGVGTRLIRALQTRAAAETVDMTLKVFRTNQRARLLYMRLGFRRYRRDAAHVAMRWPPG